MFRLAGILPLLTLVALEHKTEAALFNSAAELAESEVFAQDERFESVGLLVGTDAEGNDFVAGSGVLIAPNWVLTAGHVPQDDPGVFWESMRFFTNSDVLNNLDEVVEADFFTSFPGYLSSAPAGTGNDSFAEAREEITAGRRPLKSGVPGHARCVSGWKTEARESIGDTRHIYVLDPWPPNEGREYWENWDGVFHTNFIYVKPA